MLITIGALYVALYYLVGRLLLGELKKEDPEYFAYSKAKGGVSPSNSIALTALIFDTSMPKDFYPYSLKTKLFIVRAMLAIFPLLLIGFFWLL